ncbi:phosphatase PAP2 family protein [Streptomyces longisporoflavus]|uniref:phosphatase PAP2 family protein n=1 Tax=Streptomyces longisporoflavus TaxID=28044 RepID=UPI00167E284C|nr:phosphatase PAP2 family protein [Streptomyces longisporoflavus]GGV53458.1 phosphatase PAP2 family protein [Streptomyces longisporoflavus]
MAGLDTTGSNPDVSLLYDINGLAGDSPDWLTGSVAFVGEYGLLLALVLLVIWCWWGQRKRATLDDAASSVAAVVWAPLAAGLAVLVNVPIRGFVERRRPFKDHDGLELLVHGKTDFSFVSDHATLAMALGVGLFVANRKFGLVGIALALLEGFCRVFMGVHYPTDVVGGFALGTAVVLLLSPLAMAVLTPVAKAVGRTGRGGRLVWAGARDEAVSELPRRAASEAESESGAGAGAGSDERDLAA